MIAALKQLISLLEADAALQALLEGTASDGKIYPEISDKFENFPCVVYTVASESFNEVPRNTGELLVQFSYFTNGAAAKKKLEDIHTRVNAVVNYYVEVASDPRIIFAIQEDSRDANETDRRLFGKSSTFRIYFKNS